MIGITSIIAVSSTQEQHVLYQLFDYKNLLQLLLNFLPLHEITFFVTIPDIAVEYINGEQNGKDTSLHHGK